MRRLALLVGVLLVATPAIAQRVSVDGKNPQLPNDLGPFGGLKIECMGGTCGGGGGGTVDQGASNIADPWYVRFAAAQHIICDGGTCGGASAFLDSSAFTAGVSAINPIGCVYDDGIAALAAGQAGAPRCTSDRRLHIRSLATGTDKVDVRLRNLADGAFIEPATLGEQQTQTTALGLLLTTSTFTGRMPAGASPADAESNTNAALSRIGTFLFGYNGTTWDRLRATTANGLAVDVTRITGNVTVVQPTAANLNVTVTDGSGPLTVDGTVTANQGTANATPWNENLAQVAGGATTTVAAGTQKVGVADSSGNAIPSLTGAPVGTERGLDVRPINTVRVGTTVALNALSAAAEILLDGNQGGSFYIAAGTLAGTLAVDFLQDPATSNWVGTIFIDGTTKVLSQALTNPNPAHVYSFLAPSGTSKARVRVSAFTSGTANATGFAGLTTDPFALALCTQAAGQTVTGNSIPPCVVAGIDNGDIARVFRLLNAQPAASDYGLVTREVNLPAAAALADGRSNPTASVIEADNELFNGTTWDREHGNWRTTSGDTGSKTATFNGATQTNFDARGALILVQLGTVSGTTPTLACQLQWSFDGGTTWLSYGAVLPNLTATSQTGAIMVYPTTLGNLTGASPQVTNGLTLGSTVNITTNAPLPRTWRLAYTIGGTTPNFAITAVHVLYLR